MIEIVMQYFKVRTESFDDYYPFNSNCDLQHVYNWIKLFVYIMQKSETQFYSKFRWNSLNLTGPRLLSIDAIWAYTESCVL